jgi:hypothetical protein
MAIHYERMAHRARKLRRAALLRALSLAAALITTIALVLYATGTPIAARHQILAQVDACKAW